MINPFAPIGRGVLGVLAEIGRFTAFAARAAASCFAPPVFAGQLLRQCMAIGYYSLPVIGLTAVFIGAALALNIYVGGARFNAESFVPNIVVLGITRELGPVLAGLMLAGRVSAGIAAEIGTMRVTEQLDAMTTLSTDPFKFLIAPRVMAATITLPLLVVVADIIGVMGGYLVAVNSLDFNGATYLRNTFDFLENQDVILGLVKAAVFGFIIAAMGAYQGYNSSGGALGVGRATTNAVVGSIVLILALNYLITAFFVE
ncbi:MAG: ABC transporter permease [Hyphomonadaceae bacterium]|nr:ABC transporter permease [Hyphomonadaceae bacterium]GIK49517.1 MAG: ABC transporter permease [Alphaproteobacteria bacterium]